MLALRDSIAKGPFRDLRMTDRREYRRVGHDVEWEMGIVNIWRRRRHSRESSFA